MLEMCRSWSCRALPIFIVVFDKILDFSFSLPRSSLGLLISILGIQTLQAQTQEEINSYKKSTVLSKSIFQKIAAVPPESSLRDYLSGQYRSGHADFIALEAMRRPEFYESTLRSWFGSLISLSGSDFEDLSDSVATMIGIVRDDYRFDEIFYGNRFYTGSDDSMTFTDRNGLFSHEANVLIRPQELLSSAGKARPPFFRRASDGRVFYNSNTHFLELQKLLNWSDPSNLVERTQAENFSSLFRVRDNIDASDVMGVFTLREGLSQYMSGGTNRRPISEIFSNFLCKPLTQIHDPNVPTDYIRQDIDRLTGGDSTQFVTNCSGCHGGMDALSGAFGFWDFIGNDPTLFSNSPNNSKLYRQDSVFPQGHRVTNDSWQLYWHRGQNASMGWRQPGSLRTLSLTSGNGPSSMGRVLAATEAFSDCFAKQSFEKICSREPSDKESDELKAVAREFEIGIPSYNSYGAGHPYSLKALMARTANVCAYGKRQPTSEDLE